MKKILSLLLLIFLASNSFANSMFVEPGARANSMGAAYTAIADDATAIYYNPAGLGQLEDKGVTVDTFYMSADVKSNQSLKNGEGKLNNNEFPLPNIYLDNEPNTYQSKKFKTQATLPFAAGYSRIGESNITIGAGVYALGGGGGEWEDTTTDILGIDTIKAKANGQYGFMIGNISAGKEVFNAFFVGLGINLIYMQDKLNLQKQYINNSDLTYPTYLMGMKKDATGTGVEFTGGALYNPIDKLWLGLTLRSGSTIKLKGTAEFNQVGLTTLPIPTPFPDNYKTDYTQKYIYPMTSAIGASYDLTDNLTIATAAKMINYSSMKDDIKYNSPAIGLFDNINRKLKWKNKTQLDIGFEYRATEKLSLRAGYATDPNQYPISDLNLLNTNQYSLPCATCGIGYKLEHTTFDFNYVRNISNKPENNGTTFEYPSDSFRLGVGYNF
jgi:long-chain fatty acid transport protein